MSAIWMGRANALLRFLAAGCWLILGHSAHADEFDTLRTKWANALTGGPSIDLADPVIAAKVKSVTSTAQKYWSSMNTAANRAYLWSDLQDAAPTTTDGSAQITTGFQRLYLMALATRTSGSSLENNASLKSAVVSGVDWMIANRYRADSYREGNWWDWEIGGAIHLGNILALLYDSFTAAQIDASTKAIIAKQRQTTLTYTAANGTWQCKVWTLIGLARKNIDASGKARNYLSEVKSRIETALSLDVDDVTTDGFRSDGSFVAHTWHPYTGGYANSFLEDLIALQELYAGSSWATNGAATANICRWLYDAYAPSMYKMEFFQSVKGRYLTRYDVFGAGINVAVNALRIAAVAPDADSLKIRRMVSQWDVSNSAVNLLTDSSLSIPEYVIAKQALSDASLVPAAAPNFCKQYPVMRRTMVQRPSFAASVAMFTKDTISDKAVLIKSNESLNGETPYGAHLSDGSLQLLNDDFTQYNASYYKYLDWGSLPGTTVAAGLAIPEGGQRYVNGSNWAGGTSLDEFGVTGFELNPTDTTVYGTLHARKAWFFFDQEIVCLGSDIRGSTTAGTYRFQTVVENWKLNSAGDNALVVNGQVKSAALGWSEAMTGVTWASLAGNVAGCDTGYYFPSPANLAAARTLRGTSAAGANFLTLWISHGVKPTAGSYAYAILPNHDAASTQAYAAAAPITILENSADAQAAAKPSLGLTGALFLKNQSKTISRDGQGFLSSDKLAAVMVRENAGDIKISIADPSQESTTPINLELNRAAGAVLSRDANITVIRTSPTIKLAVAVNGSKGATYTADFSIAPIQDGSLAHWKFNGDGNDSSGFGHALISTGALVFDANAQEGTSSLSLDGSTALDAESVDLGNQFTVSGWVKLAANRSNIQTILANSAGGGGTSGFRLYVNSFNSSDGRLCLETGNGTSGLKANSVANAVAPGSWRFFTVTVDRTSGTARFYVDGNDRTSVTSTRTDFAVNQPLRVAAMQGSQYYFAGNIDDLRISSGIAAPATPTPTPATPVPSPSPTSTPEISPSPTSAETPTATASATPLPLRPTVWPSKITARPVGFKLRLIIKATDADGIQSIRALFNGKRCPVRVKKKNFEVLVPRKKGRVVITVIDRLGNTSSKTFRF